MPEWSVAEKLAIERGRIASLACWLSAIRLGYVLRKYSPQQPRDWHGRWTSGSGGTGADDTQSDDVDVTGSLREVENQRTGDPKVDALTDKLEAALSRVHDELRPGSGYLYGTEFHNEFAAAVRDMQIPDVYVETSSKDGKEVGYGTPGSIRRDVLLRDYTDGIYSTRAIWDVKTGDAVITPGRAVRIREELGVGRDVPVIQLQVRTGTTNKSRSIVGRGSRYAFW